jgi:hypothetical protein
MAWKNIEAGSEIVSEQETKCQNSTTEVKPEVQTIKDVLKREDLNIPDYQRPYKWSTANAETLVDDVREFMRFPEYRIGSFILHHSKNSNQYDIVDGQQRFITFALVVKALKEFNDVKHDLPKVDPRISPFGVEISRQNIKNNYYALQSKLENLPDREAFAEFFLNQCTIVVISIENEDEAFQMFDSQNSRGKALFPTDLLKAYHLREMSSLPKNVILELVDLWERINPDEINALFSDYLYKIICWANYDDVRQSGFSAEDISMFKGIRESDEKNLSNAPNWAKAYIYSKNFVDDYANGNATAIRHKIKKPIDYPFQITSPVINGEIFFRMVAHYHQLAAKYDMFGGEPANSGLLKDVREHNSTRYNYCKNLFDCILLAYVDRFDEQNFDEAIKTIFTYAYLPRLAYTAVQRRSVNNFALGRDSRSGINTNLLHTLLHTYNAADFSKQKFYLPKNSSQNENDEWIRKKYPTKSRRIMHV